VNRWRNDLDDVLFAIKYKISTTLFSRQQHHIFTNIRKTEYHNHKFKQEGTLLFRLNLPLVERDVAS
jgi:hypothetical protein